MENKSQTYIFFGRAGSGKGTQAELLIKKLEERNRTVLSIGTGNGFRTLGEKDNYTSRITKETVDAGNLAPVWMPIWMWGNELVENFTGEQDLVIDGAARRLEEAKIFDSAVKFYGLENVKVINIDVSREESVERLTLRGRVDDVDLDRINRRLDWHDRDVLPVLEYFQGEEGYEVININGEQSIEGVHNDISEALGLS